MTVREGSRLPSRLRLAALLAALPVALATTGAMIGPAPPAPSTAAHLGPVVDLGGAILVKSDHGDKGGDHREKSGEHGDKSGDHHDNGGDRHEGDHKGAECHNCGAENGDHHSEGGDRHEGDHNGAECHNCGFGNGDRGGHEGGGGDHKGGERGSCAPQRESLLEALVDGLCTGAETLERALTGAK